MDGHTMGAMVDAWKRLDFLPCRIFGMTGGEFLADFPGDDDFPNQSCQRTQTSRQNGVEMNRGLVLMTVMQCAGDVQVTLQLVLTRLQGGDAPTTEFIKEMHSGHVGEIGGLAGTEPACVKELHRHRHACFARKLAFRNV